MIYASSKDRFKRELDGIQVELQATDPTEMGLDVIRSRSGWVDCDAELVLIMRNVHKIVGSKLAFYECYMIILACS